MPIAVVIDGAFFLRRMSKSFDGLNPENANNVALAVTTLASYHTGVRLHANPIWQSIKGEQFIPEESPELYRIFFYDCPPLTKRLHYPISKKSLTLGKTPEAVARQQIHVRLRQVRKVALRLGRLNENFSGWRPKPEAIQRWVSDPSTFSPSDNDFEIDVLQKGVDMKLGLDIASMAFKKQVDQIILVAADADFVPAAKLARREGIDLVLDTMGAHAAPDLLEHVDGVRMCSIPGSKLKPIL